MGQNFDHYDGLQPKIRAGIINEHECNPTILDSELEVGLIHTQKHSDNLFCSIYNLIVCLNNDFAALFTN